MADLRPGRVEVRRGGALVGGGDLERAAGARRGLLEDQRDVPALEVPRLRPGPLRGLQLRGQLDQAAELLLGEVQLLEEVAAGEGGRDCRHGGAPEVQVGD
ncbi:Uncharacterised protein [Escherichia coli]|nr:Uncharacterised protein [Escherichia coli]